MRPLSRHGPQAVWRPSLAPVAEGVGKAVVGTPRPEPWNTATGTSTNPFGGGGLCPPFHHQRAKRGAGSSSARMTRLGHRGHATRVRAQDYLFGSLPLWAVVTCSNAESS